jgi:hypothetical protein
LREAIDISMYALPNPFPARPLLSTDELLIRLGRKRIRYFKRQAWLRELPLPSKSRPRKMPGGHLAGRQSHAQLERLEAEREPDPLTPLPDSMSEPWHPRNMPFDRGSDPDGPSGPISTA